jgi:exosome complex exonuclease DIS3/RRP44
MVEEFMLLANIYVAEQIHLHYPASAILRRHTQPKPKQIKDLQKLLANLGFEF